MIKKINRKPFWIRQLRIFTIVIFGIIAGALLRSLVPENLFLNLTHTYIGGTVWSIALGFFLYFGTILGNYPVAKSFFDLGMSPVGVFTFLTVSPLFNLVIIFLFASTVDIRYVLKLFVTYTITALIGSLVVALFLL